MARYLGIILSFAVAATLAGCATSPVQLGAEGSPSKGRVVAPAGCDVQMLAVVDGRKDQGSFGTVAGREVSSEDAIAWLRVNLADSMSLVEPVGAPRGVGVRVELVLANVRSISTSMSANIVAKVVIEREGTVLHERVVRGVYTRMNWASGSGEIASAMRGAVDDLARKLLPDLSQACRAAG